MLNEKYSFKDFTHQTFLMTPVEEFNDTIIRGSCFYQEKLEDHDNDLVAVFPEGMKGVTFERCNLDNVLIPKGNTVEDCCSNRRIKIQNDLEDWVIDSNGKAKEPVNKKHFTQLGISTNPSDIPKRKQEKPATRLARIDGVKRVR